MSDHHPAPVPGVAVTAPPNRLPIESLRRRPGPDAALSIDPGLAGWRYLSFRTLTLRSGEHLDLSADDQEAVVVVLGGGGVTVDPADGATLRLEGRRSVWDGLPWAVYLPVGTAARIAGLPLDAGGSVDLALARAPSSGRPGASRTPLVVRPEDCRIEVRGAGNATRQITHIVPPDFPADRLLLVEVYTPSGNWSSWPPHKHDEDAMPVEAVLEEIYSYRFRRPREDWAIQRVYRRVGTPLVGSSGPRDALWSVRHGEAVIVTDGYHPFVTAHGADAYYLNALAGDRRTMACSFDPDFDFVREAWATMVPDPRIPMVDRTGARNAAGSRTSRP